jgi:subtilisin-like proprotein convertase family protein
MRSARRKTTLLGVGAIAMLGMLLPAGASAVTFSNNDGITIPETGDSGASDPYPSVINVPTQGTVGSFTRVNFAIVEHDNMDDIDVVLVAPNGTGVFMFSDACGGMQTIQPFTVQDGAGFFSDAGPCPPTGPYSPSNYDGAQEGYIAPGPAAGTYVNNVAAFNGGPANGPWSLFVQDDNNTLNTNGSIGGWSITLDITPPAPPTNPGTTPTTPTTPATTCKKKKKKKKKRSASAAACKKKKKKKK